ncbi:hypothetical protein [Paenibacillus sp. FSL R7-0337]|uniref:PD-(D/E)XK nuclease domain-containing protein n=1 Tax=unclassified Paenibacillus TaxID=185978 RepID=UPI00096CE3CC|nr:hypothetical protein [Paenibacillus sp. FSL R7-0337]OMF96960.1 hypothetical protein BK147_12455 [Paenibacillus sp. FSL R7-0337]
MTTINEDRLQVITALQAQIQSFPQGQSADFSRWVDTTSRILERLFSDQSIAQKFVLLTRAGMLQAQLYLENLITDVNTGLFDDAKALNEVDEAHFHLIISRVLHNFDKHIYEMYQKPVHGNGTLKLESLGDISLGNEYDVQRLLYSLLRPIFPEARVEVPTDGGYKGYRFDIFIDSYETVIEVKCTRPNMSERKLTEEIGSDAYHYPKKHIYFFIYDKAKIITNVDAFCKNYNRTHDSKQIHTIVIQPIKII